MRFVRHGSQRFLGAHPSRLGSIVLLVVAAGSQVGPTPSSLRYSTPTAEQPDAIGRRYCNGTLDSAFPLRPVIPATTVPCAPIKANDQLLNEKAVVDGFYRYLNGWISVVREPQLRGELVKFATGSELQHLHDGLAEMRANNQYWDGTRTDVVLRKMKVEYKGGATATVTVCQSVGGVVRHRLTKQADPSTSGVSVDMLTYQLELADVTWRVARATSDPTQKAPGASRCAQR